MKVFVKFGLATTLILIINLCIGTVELAVLRNCCTTRLDIIDYVNDVITKAVNYRRNCRVSIPLFVYIYILRVFDYMVAQSWRNPIAIWVECWATPCTHLWSR